MAMKRYEPLPCAFYDHSHPYRRRQGCEGCDKGAPPLAVPQAVYQGPSLKTP